MSRKQFSYGFVHLGSSLVIVVVITALALGGWYVWQRNKDDNQSSKAHNAAQTNEATNNQESQDNKKEQTDFSEGGRYLVISEWGVRVELPVDMRGKVAYRLTEPSADPDGNQLQSAKIMAAAQIFPDHYCEVEETSVGPSIQTAIQYIRSESAKPFNASRYRWIFKENILKDGAYNYHINYVTPDCAASGKIETLQSALTNLVKME